MRNVGQWILTETLYTIVLMPITYLPNIYLLSTNIWARKCASVYSELTGRDISHGELKKKKNNILCNNLKFDRESISCDK